MDITLDNFSFTGFPNKDLMRVCPEGYQVHANVCYKKFDSPQKSWTDAEKECTGLTIPEGTSNLAVLYNDDLFTLFNNNDFAKGYVFSPNLI